VLTIDQARRELGCVALVDDVRPLPAGPILLETIFRYPDGSTLELFAAPSGEGEWRLTDLGQTTAWLLDQRIRPWLSKRRRSLVEDALRTFGAEQDGGELVLRMTPGTSLAEAVVRLAQTCLRVADLFYTRRTTLQMPFTEEVEELFGEYELPCEADVDVPGRFGQGVHVDFIVHGLRSRSLVLTLASQNPASAHLKSNEIFRSWYDVNVPARPDQRVTVFDDRSDAYRDADLKRLADISEVIPFTARETLRSLLAA